MAKKGIREENHEKIIQAGRVLFINQGISNTTLSQIASCAGVTKKTVLNIFVSKNNLVFKCADAVWDNFYTQLEEKIATPAYREMSGLDQVIALQVFRARRYADNPNYADLIFEIESLTCKNDAERHNCTLWTAKQSHLFSYFEKALEKGEADGSIKLKMDRTQAFTFLFIWFGSIIQRFGHIQKNGELARSLDIHTIMHNTLQQMRCFLQSVNQDFQQEAKNER